LSGSKESEFSNCLHAQIVAAAAAWLIDLVVVGRHYCHSIIIFNRKLAQPLDKLFSRNQKTH